MLYSIILGLNDTTNTEKKKQTSVAKVNTHEFSFHLLKKKIANILANQKEVNKTLFQENINDLKCKCIFAVTCWTMESKTRVKETVLMEDKVSNMCLMLLNFLILDGEENMERNLNTLYEQSLKYTDKRRSGTDEVMLEVISPIYVKIFEKRYQELKNESNHSDPFIYNQRFNAWALGGIFFDDNEIDCGEGTFCYETLIKLATNWNTISGIMKFPWDMGFGSIVANFNYMLDVCFFLGSTKAISSFQEGEHQWSGFKNNTKGKCYFDKDSETFYKDIAALSSILSKTSFQGIYLNDLFGFLGYSPAFDISSLKEDEYASSSRNIHPIYGMDRGFVDDGYDWEPCCYRSTYQRWTRNIKSSMKNHTLGVAFS